MFFFISSANASPLPCAVCAVAIAGGLSVARAFGVNDASIGIWTGAMLFSLSKWTIIWLEKKNIKNLWSKILTYLLWFGSLTFLYIGEKPNIIFWQYTMLWIDSFLLSVIVGMCVLIASLKSYYYMKEKNNGRPHFQFEKVVLPITSLMLVSIIFNYL
ncbi:MAG: hypothetical protein LBC92_05930 [Rickettsiales bacterium]|jgi:hypothetical protein|nr:hypothetical protein [Rickettsiales bacterium]